MIKSNYFDKKTVKKLLRSIVELIIIAIAGYALLKTFYSFKTYQPYEDAFAMARQDHGFITLSYINIDNEALSGEQSGTDPKSVSKTELLNQLTALKNAGYVTITQEDIVRYYNGEILLPEKSVFLLFEDGRINSAIYAQSVLEDLNYLATMVSYAENLDERQTRLLTAKNLKELDRSGFWEQGTNGYRLSYINTFDRYGNYLGVLTADEYASISAYIDNRYDHYLMDYIRDEDMIYNESEQQMTNRIAADYRLMEQMYHKNIGYLPGLYVLMHSNSGSFGTDDQVSAENERWIRNYFNLHFNREGHALNERTQNTNVYDLTRIQIQPYWSTNHLLMRLEQETGNTFSFSTGDTRLAAGWEVAAGAAEFTAPELKLTTPYAKSGQMRLLGSESTTDYRIETTLGGSRYGRHSIMLRANTNQTAYLRIDVVKDQLQIWQKTADQPNPQLLFEQFIPELTGQQQKTIGEDKTETDAATLALGGQLNYSPLAHDLEKPYLPKLKLSDLASYSLAATLTGEHLSVTINEKSIPTFTVDVNDAGSLWLAGDFDRGPVQYDGEIADKVYDAVFKDLVISDPFDSERIYADNRVPPKPPVIQWLEKSWHYLRRITKF